MRASSLTILMLPIAVLISILTVFAPSVPAQATGHIEGNSYFDPSLNFVYPLPGLLHFVPNESLNLGNPSSSAESFLMFTARKGTTQSGIIVIAQKLNFPFGPRSVAFKNGLDLINRIPAAEGSTFKEIGRKHAVLQGGFIVDELDYMNGPEYTAGIAVNVGTFLVVFKCRGESAKDLAEMAQSTYAIRKIK